MPKRHTIKSRHDEVVRAAQQVIAIMGEDIRRGRLDAWLKAEEAAALRSLERSVRRAERTDS